MSDVDWTDWDGNKFGNVISLFYKQMKVGALQLFTFNREVVFLFPKDFSHFYHHKVYIFICFIVLYNENVVLLQDTHEC